MLNLEIPEVKKFDRPPGFEERVQAIIDGKSISKAGKLNKIGIHIANGAEMLEARRRLEEMERKKKEEDDQKKADGLRTDKERALFYYRKWEFEGKRVDKDGHPNLNKNAAVTIVRYLLPKVSPGASLSEYKSMGACRKWLGELAGGTTWDCEMESLSKAEIAAELRNAPRLLPTLSGGQGSV